MKRVNFVCLGDRRDKHPAFVGPFLTMTLIVATNLVVYACFLFSYYDHLEKCLAQGESPIGIQFNLSNRLDLENLTTQIEKFVLRSLQVREAGCVAN